MPEADPGFQVKGGGGGGAHLKKLRRGKGGAKFFGVFRVKNHDFTPTLHIFFQFQEGGAGCTPTGSAPACEYLVQSVYNVVHTVGVCQCLLTGRWFSLDTPFSSTNKTDSHDIAEILLKVALNTITLTIRD